MPKKDKHKSKNKDLLSNPNKLVAKLLKWTRKGKTRRLAEVLEACGEGARSLTAVKDLKNNQTLLHQACQAGNQELVSLLLRHGADTQARDTHGNTPAHSAAASGHLLVVQQLLQSPQPPNLHILNDRGVSAAHLLEASVNGTRPPGAVGALEGPRGDGPSGARASSSGGSDYGQDDDEWSRRLADEASDGEGGREGRGSHHDSWEGAGAGLGGDDADDVWADRLWAEMQTRRRAATKASARMFASSFAEVHATQQAQRDARHAEMLERIAAADRVLKEEQEKDRTWRQRATTGGSAAAQGGVGGALPPLDPVATRKAYEQRWTTMEKQIGEGGGGGKGGKGVLSSSGLLGMADVPWPLPEGYAYDKEKLRDVLLGDAEGPADIRRRLRTELMRWHPDKFAARFTRLLKPQDQSNAMALVKEISQALTSLLAG